MLSIKENLQKTADFSKIRRFFEKAEAAIYVGFLSGRMHVETKHKNEDGEYKDLGGEEPKYNNIETAELARSLHYGNAVTPARPFLEEGLEAARDELEKAIGEELKKLEQTGGKANWDKIGTMAVGAVQDLVRSDYYKARVPNSPSTIAYKGSDTPLIDGGDLINSLEYIVEA